MQLNILRKILVFKNTMFHFFSDCFVVIRRFYGGWAAPQIFFLGFAGVVQFGGLRIGGLSGIYKKYEYNTGAVGEGGVHVLAELWQKKWITSGRYNAEEIM